MTVRAVTSMLCLLLGVLLPAQACPTCMGKGLLPCPLCAAIEAGATACSEAADCAGCKGALATVCPDCRSAAGAELQRRRTLAQQYRTDLLALLAADEVDARGVTRCRTAHFELLFAPGRIAGCPQRVPHLQLHLFATRLERMRARLLDTLGLEPPAQPIARLALLDDARDLRRLGATLTGIETQGLGGGTEHTIVLQQAAATDLELQRRLAHATAHLTLSGLALDDHGYAWLEIGLAHWLEADQGGGRCENFCLQRRPQPPRRFWDGDWHQGVRELLEQDRLPPLESLFGRDADAFDLVQHAQAFALVEFLMLQPSAPLTHAAQPPLPPLQQLMQTAFDAPAAGVLAAILGIDVAGIDAAFRAFVRQRYPRR